MSIGEFLGIQPSELKFPFELRKQSSCFVHLSNKTDNPIAFKVKTTNPKRYCVRPNVGIVLPHSVCSVTVTMQAPKEAGTPPDMQCRDKFLFQSIVVPPGTMTKDLIASSFDKRDGKIVEEFKLRAVYVPANRPATVHEEDEEGISSSREAEDEIRNAYRRSVVSKLKREKAAIEEENRKLIAELELLQKQMGSGGRRRRRFSSSWVLVQMIALLFVGAIFGYFINK